METPRYDPAAVTLADIARAATTYAARRAVQTAIYADYEAALDFARRGWLTLGEAARLIHAGDIATTVEFYAETGDARAAAVHSRACKMVRQLQAKALNRARAAAEIHGTPAVDPYALEAEMEDADENVPPPAMPEAEIHPRTDRAPMPGAGSRRDVKTGSDLHAVLSAYVAGGEDARYAYASRVLEYPVVSFGALSDDEREAVADAARAGRFLSLVTA